MQRTTHGLTVLERLTLLSVIPQEGNIVTLRVIRGLVDKVGLSAEEMRKFAIRQNGNTTEWNEEGSKPSPIEFIGIENEIIKKALDKMEAEGKLTLRHLSLYDAFCTKPAVAEEKPVPAAPVPEQA